MRCADRAARRFTTNLKERRNATLMRTLIHTVLQHGFNSVWLYYNNGLSTYLNESMKYLTRVPTAPNCLKFRIKVYSCFERQTKSLFTKTYIPLTPYAFELNKVLIST